MKKSICFMVTQGELGGAQRYVYDLATSLPKDKFEILVIMGGEKTELSNTLTRAGIKFRASKYLARGINPLKEILCVFELKNMIKDFGPHILHLNSSKAGILGSLAGKLAGVVNIVFTAHGFHFLEPNNWLIRKLSFQLEKFAAKFRKKIICVSDFDRQAAIHAGLCPAEKLITIHNGISLDAPPRKEGLGEVSAKSSMTPLISPLMRRERKITIGTIAHDYPTKDLKTLRAAFAIVKREFGSAELKIVGRGSKLGEINNAAKLLHAFDIYVCSSIKEGFPYSILEAMAAGLPIVSTSVGGIPEAIRNGTDGLLVEPRNPKSLAEAIKKILINSSLTASLGSNAKARVENFTLEKMVQATEKVYRELLTG